MKFLCFFIFCLIQTSLAQDGGFWWKKKPATTAHVQNINNRQPKEFTGLDYDYLDEIFGYKKQKEEYSVRKEQKEEEEDDSRIVFLSSEELNKQYLNPTSTNAFKEDTPPETNTQTRNTIEKPKNVNKQSDNKIKKSKTTRDVGSQQLFHMNNHRFEPASNNREMYNDESRFTFFSPVPVQIPIPLDKNTEFNIHYTQEQAYNSQSSRHLHDIGEQPTGNFLQHSPSLMLARPYAFPSTPLRSFSVTDHKIKPTNSQSRDTLDYFSSFDKPPFVSVEPLTESSSYVLSINNHFRLENSKYDSLPTHFSNPTTSLESKFIYHPTDKHFRVSAYMEPISYKFNPLSSKPSSQNQRYEEFRRVHNDYLEKTFGDTSLESKPIYHPTDENFRGSAYTEPMSYKFNFNPLSSKPSSQNQRYEEFRRVHNDYLQKRFGDTSLQSKPMYHPTYEHFRGSAYTKPMSYKFNPLSSQPSYQNQRYDLAKEFRRVHNDYLEKTLGDTSLESKPIYHPTYEYFRGSANTEPMSYKFNPLSSKPSSQNQRYEDFRRVHNDYLEKTFGDTSLESKPIYHSTDEHFGESANTEPMSYKFNLNPLSSKPLSQNQRYDLAKEFSRVDNDYLEKTFGDKNKKGEYSGRNEKKEEKDESKFLLDSGELNQYMNPTRKNVFNVDNPPKPTAQTTNTIEKPKYINKQPYSEIKKSTTYRDVGSQQFNINSKKTETATNNREIHNDESRSLLSSRPVQTSTPLDNNTEFNNHNTQKQIFNSQSSRHLDENREKSNEDVGSRKFNMNSKKKESATNNSEIHNDESRFTLFSSRPVRISTSLDNDTEFNNHYTQEQTFNTQSSRHIGENREKSNEDVGSRQFNMSSKKTESATNNSEIHNDESRFTLFSSRPVRISTSLDNDTEFNNHYTQEQTFNTQSSRHLDENREKSNEDVGSRQFNMSSKKTESATNNSEIHNDESRFTLFLARPVQISTPLDNSSDFNIHYTQEQIFYLQSSRHLDENREQSTDGRNADNFHERHHHYGHRHKPGRFMNHPPGHRGSWNYDGHGRRGYHRHNNQVVSQPNQTSSNNYSDIQLNNTQHLSSVYLRNVTEDFIKQKVQEFARDMNVLKIISNIAGFHLEGKINFKINPPTNNTRNDTNTQVDIYETLTNAVTTEASLQGGNPGKNHTGIEVVFGVNGSASTSKDDGCVCVYYFLCNDGRVNTDGAGIIDLRFAVCPEFTHVCCKLQNIQGELENGNATKIDDPLPTQKIDQLPTTTARLAVNKPDENDADIRDDLLSEIFSLDATKFETTTTNSGGCVCVAYFLCDDGVVNTDGTALIDLRFAPDECPDFEVCCKVPKNSTTQNGQKQTEEATLSPGKPDKIAGLSNANNNDASILTTTAKPGLVVAAAANSNDDCVCVDYFLCDDGVINTDGGGLIDLRFNACPEDHQVCCKKRRAA